MMLALEHDVTSRPALLVSHGDPDFVAELGQSFRQLGWRIYRTDSGPALRRRCRLIGPALVVLDADLCEESGWLTCAKLTAEQPGCRVVLVCNRWTPRHQQFADFVGAVALYPRGDGMEPFVDAWAYAGMPALR